MHARCLSLIVPNLFDILSSVEQVDDFSRRSSLAFLLSRARLSRNECSSIESELLRQFKLSASADDGVSVAALTARQDLSQSDQTSFLMRIDPVYLQADRAQLRLLAHGDLDLSPDEAATLVEHINAHFASEEWQLVAGPDSRWYLLSPTQIEVHCKSPGEIIGADIQAHLPHGEHSRQWRGWLNEIQMLLHEHPINIARQAAGKLPVNSVWLWGNGQLPESTSRLWDTVSGEHYLLQALAEYSGSEYLPTPDGAQQWFTSIHEGQHLVYLDEFSLRFDAGDVDNIVSQLSEFEQNWLKPLVEEIRYHRASKLFLYGGTYTAILDPVLARRWWRRIRPVQHHLT